jgi:hypothetical protein
LFNTHQYEFIAYSAELNGTNLGYSSSLLITTTIQQWIGQQIVQRVQDTQACS